MSSNAHSLRQHRISGQLVQPIGDLCRIMFYTEAADAVFNKLVGCTNVRGNEWDSAGSRLRCYQAKGLTTGGHHQTVGGGIVFNNPVEEDPVGYSSFLGQLGKEFFIAFTHYHQCSGLCHQSQGINYQRQTFVKPAATGKKNEKLFGPDPQSFASGGPKLAPSRQIEDIMVQAIGNCIRGGIIQAVFSRQIANHHL